jgi:hypothetical protein
MSGDQVLSKNNLTQLVRPQTAHLEIGGGASVGVSSYTNSKQSIPGCGTGGSSNNTSIFQQQVNHFLSPKVVEGLVTDKASLAKKLAPPYNDIQLGNDYHNLLIHRENVKQLIKTATLDNHVL